MAKLAVLGEESRSAGFGEGGHCRRRNMPDGISCQSVPCWALKKELGVVGRSVSLSSWRLRHCLGTVGAVVGLAKLKLMHVSEVSFKASAFVTLVFAHGTFDNMHSCLLYYTRAGCGTKSNDLTSSPTDEQPSRLKVGIPQI
jgi:hypothetical protein